MKPHVASAINAALMITLGFWGYKESSSITAMIPVLLGVLLLPLNNGVRYESKVVSHVAVIITLLAVMGLGMALKGTIERGQTLPIARVAIMLVSAIVAMIVFIKSFIEAKKKREQFK